MKLLRTNIQENQKINLKNKILNFYALIFKKINNQFKI